MIYLDTSIIAPFYWAEALSDPVEELLRTETELGLSRLVEVELFSALSRRVRIREISQEDAKEITIQFQTHVDNDFYIRIPLETAHYQLACELIGRFDTPSSSIIHFIAYPADTLYILTENQDTTVSQLMDLGKKWRADSVDVTDGTNEDYGWRLQRRLRTRLEGALSGEPMQPNRDAVIISYWWD